MITHRCEGNRKEKCPIRYVKQDHWHEDSSYCWMLYKMDYHSEAINPFVPYMDCVAPIKFCPFCGEKLEVEE